MYINSSIFFNQVQLKHYNSIQQACWLSNTCGGQSICYGKHLISENRGTFRNYWKMLDSLSFCRVIWRFVQIRFIWSSFSLNNWMLITWCLEYIMKFLNGELRNFDHLKYFRIRINLKKYGRNYGIHWTQYRLRSR